MNHNTEPPARYAFDDDTVTGGGDPPFTEFCQCHRPLYGLCPDSLVVCYEMTNRRRGPCGCSATAGTTRATTPRPDRWEGRGDTNNLTNWS